LALAGCGFAPAYGTGGVAGPLRNTVDVSAPDTVAGFRLRTRISDRLGAATIPRYTLTVALREDQTAAAITTAGDTTRLNLRGFADWTVTDRAGKVLTNGNTQTFTSYSATGSTVATQAAATDAQARLAVALADMIVAELTATAGTWAQ
jgi:LPS-assembly lipoprotein